MLPLRCVIRFIYRGSDYSIQSQSHVHKCMSTNVDLNLDAMSITAAFASALAVLVKVTKVGSFDEFISPDCIDSSE